MYDLIGDIHGQAGKLRALLAELGYQETEGAYRHPERQVIFLGDFVDRGPAQWETLTIAQAMVEAGTALAVMGNHEFNAMAWHSADPNKPGAYLRPHNDKNRQQHQAFLDEFEDSIDDHADIIEWFFSLPLWLELDGLRVIHACWHPEYITQLRPRLARGNRLTPALLERASRKGRWEYEAVETLLKGMEISLPDGHHFHDKDGHIRHHTRIRWWDSNATSYRTATLLGEKAEAALPDMPLPVGVVPGYRDDIPVFIGHYWLTGTPQPLTPRVACLDYSAGKGGPLCGYRWDGERELRAEKFVTAD